MNTQNARPVPGWDGYFATEDGNVISTMGPIYKKGKKGLIGYAKGKKWKSIGWIGNHGYRMVTLTTPIKHKTLLVQDVILTTFKGQRPSPGHQAAHKDGNRLNNAIANLRWATPKENEADKVDLGLHNRGERHGLSKLQEEDIHDIRAMAHAGLTQKQIAKAKDISQGTVSNILLRKAWKHIA